MADDPFAHLKAAARKPDSKLRLAKPEPDDAAPASDDPRAYAAVRIASKPPSLSLYMNAAPGRDPVYAALIDVIRDDDFGSCFSLIYNFMTVHVSGRNLLPVMQAIHSRKASALREFDAERFDAPGDTDPVIDRIEVVQGQVIQKEVDWVSGQKTA
jgi:hypothetical protein